LTTPIDAVEAKMKNRNIFERLTSGMKMSLVNHILNEKGTTAIDDGKSKITKECKQSLHEILSNTSSDKAIKIYRDSPAEAAAPESIGEIICIDKEALIGLAMIKLSALVHPSNIEDIEHESLQFKAIFDTMDSTHENSPHLNFKIYPFMPDWWPELDPITGNKVIE
jgi:vacuolar-type H+-ATPase subunit H